MSQGPEVVSGVEYTIVKGGFGGFAPGINEDGFFKGAGVGRIRAGLGLSVRGGKEDEIE
jgi:hypothetical protein